MPTGIEFLDRIMGGGIPDHGLTAIVAPTGVGASVLASMIVAQGCANEEAKDPNNSSNRRWLYYDRHNGTPLTAARLLSYMTGIDRNWFLKPSLFRGIQEDSQNEEANTKAFAVFKRRLQLSPEEECFGDFFAIAKNVLERSLSHDIAGIVIDGFQNIEEECYDDWHANLGSLKHLGSAANFYHVYAVVIFRNLAESLKCPVVFTHHANARGSEARPIDPFKRANAKECPKLIDYVDAGVFLGNKSGHDSGLFAIECVKSPFLTVSKARKVVVRHDDVVSTIQVVEDVYADVVSGDWKPRLEVKELLSPEILHDVDALMAELCEQQAREIGQHQREEQSRQAETPKESEPVESLIKWQNEGRAAIPSKVVA